MRTRVFYTDVNGTLTRYDTMPDLAKLVDPSRYEQAIEIFTSQTHGALKPGHALKEVAKLTRGLTLKQAIDYSSRLKYFDGFEGFMETLRHAGIPLHLISTGYTVTFHTMRHCLNGAHPRHTHEVLQDWIGNSLVFARRGHTLEEEELGELVERYFSGGRAADSSDFLRYKATGRVKIMIETEQDKFDHLTHHKWANYPGLRWAEVAAMGDSYGDFNMLVGTVTMGGKGIAFNYNAKLEKSLSEWELVRDNPRLLLIDRKPVKTEGEGVIYPNLLHALPALGLWENVQA